MIEIMKMVIAILPISVELDFNLIKFSLSSISFIYNFLNNLSSFKAFLILNTQKAQIISIPNVRPLKNPNTESFILA